MSKNTIRLLAHLLDMRALFEACRAGGHIQEEAPSARPAEALYIRDRTWVLVDKLLGNEPLDEEEMELAREGLAWWQEHPGTDNLPFERMETLLDIWHLPPETPSDEALHALEMEILHRWRVEESPSEKAAPDGPRVGSNGEAPTSILQAPETAEQTMEDLMVRVRAGLSVLERWVHYEEPAEATYVLREYEELLEKLREALMQEIEANLA